MKEKEGTLELEGLVIDALPESRFRVQLDNGVTVLAYCAGRLRTHRIRILLGDRVKVEMSPYDLSKARIVYRNPTSKVVSTPQQRRR
ncbi:translation initiation factor IF-1 [Chitinolyticbacter meiyuanensis]|uniref:translation initiation factor IF-1 n=1 Tax=Chitinolyticbacter meiyuanensis TaxID=682798 RepID=UPI0011E5FFC8|nr:translation initiation factor IF-1 [Chitinolyticbacter meiyuanensis]